MSVICAVGADIVIQAAPQLSGECRAARRTNDGQDLRLGFPDFSALAAEGTTEISRVYHIDRGYQQ